MKKLPEILICDDDQTFHLSVKFCLKNQFECRSAYNCDEAIAIIKNNPIQILLLDVQMRSPDEGLKYLPEIKSLDDELQIIMTSGRTDFNTVREAMRLGAVDYIPKDFDPNELAHLIRRVLERRELLGRKSQQNFEIASEQKQHLLLGECESIIKLRKTIEKMRVSSSNVLITGETGTGKEVVARQMRKTLTDGSLAPFVAVDSATIQSSMAESILFGHEKGAFTGAEKITKGLFEEAHGGIIYFDEIGNMPLEIQAKLLRVLQEKEIIRLGSSKVIQLDFRVICATNRDLEKMVREHLFKEDLLQRLNVLPIVLPALRERTEDISILIHHFVTKLGFHDERSAPICFTEEAIETFKKYSWPGNIRELSNLISYLSTMIDGNQVDLADLPPKYREQKRIQSTPAAQTKDFYARVASFESSLLADEFSRCDGNVSKLALTLGMDRSHLYSKLKEYGIYSPRTK